MAEWYGSADALARAQERLRRAEPPPWRAPREALAVGASFVCFERGPSGPGRKGERGWAGA
ncbi:MAG TPA: hypothetical protein VE269_00925, partial [Gaiellaceae bacterium]|nr:hypothetical protein [Gaiellaceae bacterium]